MSSSLEYENHFYHIRWPPLNVTIFITHVRRLRNGSYDNAVLWVGLQCVIVTFPKVINKFLCYMTGENVS